MIKRMDGLRRRKGEREIYKRNDTKANREPSTFVGEQLGGRG